jgi:hypothetical protein
LEQHLFFQHVEESYSTLTNLLIPLIEAEFCKWKQGFTISRFEEEFWLVYLSIPTLDSRPVRWEWAFETIHDRNHTLTVAMIDDLPHSILFDG